MCATAGTNWCVESSLPIPMAAVQTVEGVFPPHHKSRAALKSCKYTTWGYVNESTKKTGTLCTFSFSSRELVQPWFSSLRNEND